VSSGFVYIWEFHVARDKQPEFERHYGSNGSWAQLFRRAGGYIETQLLKDNAHPERYLTIDRWQSEEAWQNFRVEFSEDYARLDGQCEALTASETFLGAYSDRGGQTHARQSNTS
jgi:heme-degrading monooxygenase HmoA